jgi:predicted dinucleotide-binding enzyme
MKKIGILGSGIVGKTLATGFLRHGYDVMIGSRNPDKLKEWKQQNENKGKIGTFEETARFGEIIVFAIKGTAAEDALKEAGIDNFRGKTIIDTTNPISENEPPVNGVLKFFTGPNESIMQNLQKIAPQAHFVKAFNCVGNAVMVNPEFSGGKPAMFICGDNDNAKQEVRQILDSFGWDTEDCGKAESAPTIENLCILWLVPAFMQNDWHHAFKVVR